MDTVKEYKCPCCGGAINFDTNLQKMKCPYCETEFEIETLKIQDEDCLADKDDKTDWNISFEKNWKDEESSGMKLYSCQSCAGEIVCDETTAATSCPYCGNPVVVVGNLKGELRPDLIIPFKLDKNSAKEALANHLKGKRLLPKVFKDKNHIGEIKGIYVPFWLFDANVDANIRYRATRTTAWSDSRYDYIKTSHFSVFRGGKVGFKAIPVDGSSKMADDMMESIEPFDLKDAVDFQPAYLAGFFADKYDVDKDNSINRANERIKKSTEEVFADTVFGYESVITEASSIEINNGAAKYALLPVWLLSTNWNNQNFIFSMNGQTGKFAGNLPLDKGAYFKWLLIYAAAFFCVSFVILSLIL